MCPPGCDTLAIEKVRSQQPQHHAVVPGKRKLSTLETVLKDSLPIGSQVLLWGSLSQIIVAIPTIYISYYIGKQAFRTS